MPSSDIGSVRSDQAGLRAYEAKSELSALAYNSRLRGVVTFLSSDSESTQNMESIGYLSDPLDFCVPSYGSVSEFWLKTEKSPMGSTDFGRRFTPEV